MKKALLVGINNYPGSPLQGCVNDVINIARLLIDQCNFRKEEISMLVDSRATKKEIINHLRWLISGAQPGDKLIFHFSGHGVQLPTRNTVGELDGLDEVICPYDFNWTEETSLRDKEFNQLFSNIPQGTQFTWLSDSCHSGDLHRLLENGSTHETYYRTIVPPLDVMWELEQVRDKNIELRNLKDISSENNILFISGCKSNQLSADAYINGSYNGAMTYFLTEILRSQGLNVPMNRVVSLLNEILDRQRYNQDPQIHGVDSLQNIGFMATEALGV